MLFIRRGLILFAVEAKFEGPIYLIFLQDNLCFFEEIDENADGMTEVRGIECVLVLLFV